MPLQEPQYDTVIVRFGGEIGIKALWTRKLYERRLIGNIKAAMKHYDISYARFVRRFGRLYIKTTQAEKTAQKLSQVLGIASTSPAIETTSSLNDILDTSVKLAGTRLRKGQSLAVRCHRVGKHPYTSQEVCRQVGQKVLTTLRNLNLRVDLTHPDETLNIEVREDSAYVFPDVVKGAGGLPLGTQPKLVCLLGGDMSSALACWMTMKRGCPAIFVNFQNVTDAPEMRLDKVGDASQRLMAWSIGFPRRLYTVNWTDQFLTAAQKHPPIIRAVLCKRFMLRVAQRLAQKWRAEGIVTGDTLGRGQFHTIHFFRVEDEAAEDYPVYRPSLGLGIQEIAAIAQKIGLKEEDSVPQEMKKEPPTHVARRGRVSLEDVKHIEEQIGVEEMVDEALRFIKDVKF